MLFLQRYNFAVSYRKGSSLHLADTLSRAPCRDEANTPSMPNTFQVFRTYVAQIDPSSPSLTDETRELLRRATASCQDMQSLAHYIIHGWPPIKDHLPQRFRAFWHFREELSITGIVPSSLCPSMLTNIHHSHRVPEYCLHFAREAIFWPSMSKDIEEFCHFCHSCPTCAQYGKQATTEPMLSHPTPSLSW